MGPRRWPVLVLLAPVFVTLSCADGEDVARRPGSPSEVNAESGAARTGGDEPAASPEPGASPGTAAPPQPEWTPVGTFACPLGEGDPHAVCAAGTPAFAAEVDAAVAEVIAARPDLFSAGEGAPRILDEEAFHLAVVALLQERGFCAGWDVIDLQVRDAAGFSERYDLFDWKGRLNAREDRFRSTCRPADFPVTAHERIASLRVAFYGITCPDGRTPPRNAEGRIPLGCTGHVTATPKDVHGNDVDARVHGPYIDWRLEQRYAFVRAEDYPGVPFNKVLRSQERGDFRLCATVQGHTSCLEARVTAN